MNKKKISKESLSENFRIIEYNDGSTEEIFEPSLLESASTEDEAKIQERINIINYRTLSKSDKQNLSIESKLDYISTLLEYLLSNLN